MFGRVDEADTVAGVGQEGSARRHGLEDAEFVLLAEIFAVANLARYQADQRLGAMGVEVVDDEDPRRLRVESEGPLDMGGEILVVPRDRDGRGKDLTGCDLEVGGQAANAVSDVFDLAAFHKARLHGQRRPLALQGLHTGLFVGANDANALLGEGRGLEVEVADRLNLLSERLGVVGLFPDEPVADLVRLEGGLILKNATRNRERCSLRYRAAQLLRPAQAHSNG
jgi:hypothetical protein